MGADNTGIHAGLVFISLLHFNCKEERQIFRNNILSIRTVWDPRLILLDRRGSSKPKREI